MSYGLDDGLHLLVGEIIIDGEGDFAREVVVGNGVVLDVVAGVAVEAEHRQRDEMHVHADLELENALHDFVALLFGYIVDSERINVVGGLFLCGFVGGDLEASVVAEGVAVSIKNLLAAGKCLTVVAFQFHDADGGQHVGHVALVAGFSDVIAPVARLRLGERIFALSVQRFDFQLFV